MEFSFFSLFSQPKQLIFPAFFFRRSFSFFYFLFIISSFSYSGFFSLLSSLSLNSTVITWPHWNSNSTSSVLLYSKENRSKRKNRKTKLHTQFSFACAHTVLHKWAKWIRSTCKKKCKQKSAKKRKEFQLNLDFCLSYFYFAYIRFQRQQSYRKKNNTQTTDPFLPFCFVFLWFLFWCIIYFFSRRFAPKKEYVKKTRNQSAHVKRIPTEE